MIKLFGKRSGTSAPTAAPAPPAPPAEPDLATARRVLERDGFAVYSKAAARDYDRYLDQEEFRYVLWLDRIYEKTRCVPGHVVEVGVARGRNAVIFGHLIGLHGEDSVRNYYGFDTFAGYAEEDLRRSPHLSPDEWKATTLEFVQERLRLLNLQRICHVFKGDIREAAPAFLASRQLRFTPGNLKIALLYIDCNAYAAARFTLDFFSNYLSPGAIICIDEKLQGGETEALLEFCREHALPFRKDPGPFGVPAYTVWAS